MNPYNEFPGNGNQDPSIPIQALNNLSLNPGGRSKSKRSARVFHSDLNVPDAGVGSAPFTGAPGGAPVGGAPVIQGPEYSRPGPQVPVQSQAYEPGSRFGQGLDSSERASDSVIPSIVMDRHNFQRDLGADRIFKTFENACPPPADIQYNVIDQGNAGPQFARLSMYNVPVSEALRSQTKLPLGMLITPFAPSLAPRDSDLPVSVPEVDFSEQTPPRCLRCRTYINCVMFFTDGGTKFVCNMCQFANPVSGDYFQPTDASNRRIDWHERPELSCGTYDMIVPKEYWKDDVEPHVLNHLVLIDVSMDSIRRELPKLTADAIRKVLYDDSNGNKAPFGTKIAIATYDRSLQFYNLDPSLEQPQMIVVNDTDDPFIPLEQGLFVDVYQSRRAIEALLDRIDILFADTHQAENSFGGAVKVGYEVLRALGGGKVSVILGGLPTWGIGSLVIRDGKPNYSEKDLATSDNTFYRELGQKYAQAGIGLDMYAFPSGSVDLANSAEICRTSGGKLFYYPTFVPLRDGQKFISEFGRRIIVSNSTGAEIGTSGAGYAAQLKVRCSTGLQVAAYYGNFYHENWPEDPSFGTVDCDTTIGVLFSYDGKLDTKLDAHFQSALLYTGADGKRRVRITNTVASVTEQFKAAVNFVDMDACMGIITRDSLSKLGTKPAKDLRGALNERLVEVFASYRKAVNSNASSTQLLMPMALRSAMLYVLSLQKSRLLRDTQITNDTRIYVARLLNSVSADSLSLYLYPRIVGLHNLNEDDATFDEETGQFRMPINIAASMTAVQDGGVYMAFNGQKLLVYIQRQVSPNLLQDLFAVSGLDQIDSNFNEFPVIETAISIKSRNLVKHFASIQHIDFLSIQLARQGLDGAEHEYAMMMVEDRTMDIPSYEEYVKHLHRHVKLFIENGNSKGILNEASLMLAQTTM